MRSIKFRLDNLYLVPTAEKAPATPCATHHEETPQSQPLQNEDSHAPHGVTVHHPKQVLPACTRPAPNSRFFSMQNSSRASSHTQPAARPPQHAPRSLFKAPFFRLSTKSLAAISSDGPSYTGAPDRKFDVAGTLTCRPVSPLNHFTSRGCLLSALPYLPSWVSRRFSLVPSFGTAMRACAGATKSITSPM